MYPGPIYNDELVSFEPLLKDPKNEYVPIKAGLREGIDFMLVPDAVWSQWNKNYGGFDIRRKAYPPQEGEEKPFIDVFLQRVVLVFTEHFVSEVPEGKQVTYIGRRELTKSLIEKCRRGCIESAGHDKMYQMKVQLWKLIDPDSESLENAVGTATTTSSRKAGKTTKFPIGIDGEMLPAEKVIEELAIGNSTIILVEVSPDGEPSIFVERKIVKPRIAEFTDTDWKKYVTVEERAFAKIPLKAIVSNEYNCGRTGLENLGNTCYMNSGLQCLSSCQELTKYFLLGLYKNEINKENPLGQKGYLAQAYAELILDMWKGSSRVMTAYNLKKRIAIKSEQFSGYAQHDSQELILYVLDGLHEDLNRIKKKPYIESKDYNGTPDRELSIEQWGDYLKRNKSVIVDLFCGQLKSRVVCPFCKKDSVTFDPFMVMSVPIPQLSVIEVTFVYSDFAKGSVNVKLVVNEGSIMADLAYKLSEHIRFDSEKGAKLFYAVVQNGRIFKRLDAEISCNEAKTLGDIFVYEYFAEDTNNKGCSEQYFLEVDLQFVASGFWGTNKYPLNYPLIIPALKTASLVTIKQAIMAKLLPFMKEIAVPKGEDRVKFTYKHYFSRSKYIREQPYQLEIVNNRPKTTKYLVSTKYTDCEFCTRGGHTENCRFDFENEDRVTLGALLKMLKSPRDLILNLVLMETSENGIDVETLKKHFSNTLKVETRLPKTNKISLYDCLECFSKEEQLDTRNMWYCPKCKKSVQATKKMDMYKLPDILIIHLKRFKHKASSMWSSNKKIDDFVEYPIAGLDLKRYLKSPPEISGDTTYDLFGVSNHFGGLSGGHYTATCYNAALGKWLYFNDSYVSYAGEEDIVSSAGYVLFYRRVDNKV